MYSVNAESIRQFSVVIIIIIPILQQRKLRHRELKLHAQYHTVRKWQSQDLSPDSVSKPVIPQLLSHCSSYKFCSLCFEIFVAFAVKIRIPSAWKKILTLIAIRFANTVFTLGMTFLFQLTNAAGCFLNPKFRILSFQASSSIAFG